MTKAARTPTAVEKRILELKERIGELTGGESTWLSSHVLPPEILERFLQNVLDWEEAKRVRPLDVLVEGGLELPAADTLDDQALAEKLGELIQAMAHQGLLLAHTDHLSDRQLYVELVEHTLVAEIVLPPAKGDGPRGYYILDMTQGGQPDGTNVYLKYYADDEARRDWAERWPDDVIPDHEDPPYDRDRTLP